MLFFIEWYYGTNFYIFYISYSVKFIYNIHILNISNNKITGNYISLCIIDFFNNSYFIRIIFPNIVKHFQIDILHNMKSQKSIILSLSENFISMGITISNNFQTYQYRLGYALNFLLRLQIQAERCHFIFILSVLAQMFRKNEIISALSNIYKRI